jgi:hypothetical protein
MRPTTRTPSLRRWRSDAGFVTGWTVALAVTSWALVGLVYDGGRAVRARSDAFGAAAAAARVGTQELETRDLVLGVARLDRDAASRAALEVMELRGFDATVEVTDNEVSVTATGDTSFTILPGSSNYTVTATARVVAGRGER